MRKTKPGREAKKPKQPRKPPPLRPQAGQTDPRFFQLADALIVGKMDVADALLCDAPNLLHLRNGVGETLLHFLVVENQTKAVAWLWERGADLNTRNDFDGTPLMDVVKLGYGELCRFLLDHGASMGFADHINDTALTLAARKAYETGDVSLLPLLLEHATPADIALSQNDVYQWDKINEMLLWGTPELVALLRAHGFGNDEAMPAIAAR